MENKTYYTTLALIYFGFCAVLWNIGYWSVFDLNIFSYYGLIDILKDFTYPFLIHSGVPILIYLVLISVDISNSHKDTDKTISLRPKPKYCLKFAQYKYIFTSIAIVLFVTATYLDFKYKYFILPFIAALTSSVVFIWNRFLKNFIPYPYIRFLTIFIVVYIPTSIFCEARYLGLYTKTHPKNLHIKIQMNNATYANNVNDVITHSGGDFLGSTSDKVFFTDSMNSKIIIVNIKDAFSITFETEAIKTETEKIQ